MNCVANVRLYHVSMDLCTQIKKDVSNEDDVTEMKSSACLLIDRRAFCLPRTAEPTGALTLEERIQVFWMLGLGDIRPQDRNNGKIYPTICT